MAHTSAIGVIVLGNSGVGKSFIGNVLLDHEVFKHQFRSKAVTTKTEYQECTFGGKTYAVYNIPGLIESEQERIDLNKREIDVAFKKHPYAVVFYVFGHQNGRIRNEDVVAFNAINSAYPLSQKSLVVIVNGLTTNRPSDYEFETTADLTNLLKMHLPYICYVDQINSPSEKQAARCHLIETIAKAMPKMHEKQHDIQLHAAELSKLVKQIAEFQKQIQEDREQHHRVVEKLQREFEAKEQQQRVDNERRRQEAMAERQALANQIQNLKIETENQRKWERQQQEQYQQQLAIHAEERRNWERQQREEQERRIEREAEIFRRDDPLRVIANVAAAPVHTVAGTIRGTATGYQTVVKPFADFIGNSDNNTVLRVAAVPVGAVGGIVGGAVGAVAGTVKGAGTGISRILGGIYGD